MEDNKSKVDSLIVNDPKKPSRMFAHLKEGEIPLVPLPQDNMSDISYPQFVEPRCTICTSTFRDLAEHVYLETGKKAQSVINFFAKHS